MRYGAAEPPGVVLSLPLPSPGQTPIGEASWEHAEVNSQGAEGRLKQLRLSNSLEQCVLRKVRGSLLRTGRLIARVTSGDSDTRWADRIAKRCTLPDI